MNSQLLNLIAQMESWEAANEFGIPEVSWADYDVKRRSDDLYISCLANVFDALRTTDTKKRLAELDALAKTLVIYSRSAAAKLLTGVERHLNQLYSGALYYLADRPATANFLTRNLVSPEDAIEEEIFLRDFLGHALNDSNELTTMLKLFMRSGDGDLLGKIIEDLEKRRRLGLIEDPRKFIAASLSVHAVRRFAETNVWSNLQRHSTSAQPETWEPFFFNSRSFPMWELLPSQISAFQSGMLKMDSGAVSLQMPTSAGKTSLCEVLIFDEVRVRHRKVLFLVPFRALAAEIAAGMSGRLQACGINIMASYGGNLPTRSETTSVETADVLIITPEKFTALAQVIPGLENEFQTIVCDEGHLIDDKSRGLSYELLLTKLRADSPKGPRKIIFMSAILPNMAEIHSWLGGAKESLVNSEYKPVETDYAFLAKQDDSRWKLEVNPFYAQPRRYFLNDFLTLDDFRYRNLGTGRLNSVRPSSNAALACAAALRARHNGGVAVFTTTKNEKLGIPALAAKLLEFCDTNIILAQNAPTLPASNKFVHQYISFILGSNYSLSRLLPHGAGFHHGSLPQEIRRTMEESIANGSINILFCTTTLAEGVNLPIRTLVVHTFRRFDVATSKQEFIHRRSIKNILGRVGRAGKETRGRVIFVNKNEHSHVIETLKNGVLEPARGRLVRLIELIEKHFRENNIALTNDVLEKQQPWFLALLDSIDQSIINLVPEGTSNEQIMDFINELLDGTLAKHQTQNDAIKETLSKVFRLRAESLQHNIERDSWPILKKSGASPRFWNFANDSELLNLPIWQTLENPLDATWCDQILNPLLKHTGSSDATSSILIQIINGWLSGLTYAEIAETCGQEVDSILSIMCDEIGFSLQDSLAKLCQLALAKHGEGGVSETAQAWPSLLQYGLATLQQLDLYERGASDRLAVWGIQRFLHEHKILIRGQELLQHLRKEHASVREAIGRDNRVPQLCAQRIFRELKIRAA